VRRPGPRRTGPGQLPRSPFGLIDELNCYYDTPAEPNNIHLEVLVPGRVDYPALRQAVAGALAAAPRARGRMAARSVFRRRYTWEFPPVLDLDPLSHVAWTDEDELAAARVRFLDSSPPLGTSPPVRLLLASGPGASCVLLNAHHAAMDGMSSLELLRDIATRYRAITGDPARPRTHAAEASPLSAGPVSAGTVMAGPVSAGPVSAGTVMAGPVSAGPVSASAWSSRTAPPRPAPPPRARIAARLPYPVARIAPERERRGRRDGYGLCLLPVPGIPRAPGGTVNDTLIAALVATISRWNGARRRAPRAIRVTVPVNVRDPGLRGVAGNHSRIATVTVDPRTAAGDLSLLLAAVTRQTTALRQAHQRRASAGALGRAPGWCPVALKRLAVQFALRSIGPIVCDTCMLTNLGDAADAPWSYRGPVRMALSGPAHMPRGLAVAAVTADGHLRLGFRYRYALFDEAAAACFTASYAAALAELTSGARPPQRCVGGDTSGSAGGAAQDSRMPGRQGLPHVLRRREPAVQPAPEARLPD
jgi:NRPS condensation-like uncharacterized protein